MANSITEDLRQSCPIIQERTQFRCYLFQTLTKYRVGHSISAYKNTLCFQRLLGLFKVNEIEDG